MTVSSVSQDARSYRLTNIDMLRGLVIVIMAIDHVRDLFMISGVQAPMAQPDISAEAMYEPRIWARQPGAEIEITAPWAAAL